MTSTNRTHARRSTTFTATRNPMHHDTTTHDTTLTAARNSMPTETTTHDTNSTTTRKPMPAETTTHQTSRRHFTIRHDDHDDALRASQVDSVAVDEIAWLFTCSDDDVASVAARAVIDARLATLDPADQQALALRYDPLPCPPSLKDEWHEGFALALSLASAARWRPVGLPCPAVERLASEQLADAVRRHGPGVLRGIRRRADWAFATAMRAYAKARGRAPSALSRHAA
jgi:hypothetical protein